MRYLSQTNSRLRRRGYRSGSAAIEFAIVLPLLLLVLSGATDFGRFSYSTIALANAARSGAAYGSMNPYTSQTHATWQAEVRQAVVDELSESPAFDPSKLTVSAARTIEAGGLSRVSVEVVYPFKTVVNWAYIPASVNLKQTVVMRGVR